METNCCPPEEPKQACCSPGKDNTGNKPSSPTSAPEERPGYSIAPFVCGWIESPVGRLPRVTSRLKIADHCGRWAMRWGLGRTSYRVTPGLYAVGTPDADSPLLVSANYKLSFDCLRSALHDLNAWILVLDTKGINVWCAAGKGTFGTEEIVRRCKLLKIEHVVNHRQMIVPQLGAPGVAAHLVKKETGFTVVYGPVRAKDLPVFIRSGMTTTPGMRRVTFSFIERLVLTPVEITMMRKTALYAVLALFLLSGIGSDIFSFQSAWERGLAALIPGLAGLLAGCVITPVLLPWLPSRLFSVKGALVGLVASVLLATTLYREASYTDLVALFLFVGAIASYTAMNFTGSTTYTSPSGVEKEMRMSIPWQVVALLTAGLIWVGTAF